MDIRGKIAPWYLLFGLPFMFLAITRARSAPWWVSLLVHLLGTVIIAATYESFAYRVTTLSLLRPFLLNFAVAFVVAILFALFAGIDLADMLRERPH